ncbi:histidine kinase dimerization/phospho-acceptor domain-containing protein [Bacillus sp. AK128]
MDTKWRNRIVLVAWLVLFTFGVSGLLTALFSENDYMKESYFETRQFERTMENYTRYLLTFGVTDQSMEEMKENISVTEQEIEEYRNEYGSLADRVVSIGQQYDHRIDEAQATNKQDVAELYIKERDNKIDEITNIFENDEYVVGEIIEEKEARIHEYFTNLERYRATFESYDEVFAYYLKDTSSGKVYTNLLNNNLSAFNTKNMHFTTSYPLQDNDYIEPLVAGYVDLVDDSYGYSHSRFEGKIGVSKDAPQTNQVIQAYENYGKERMSYWICLLVAIIALISSLFIGKRTGVWSKIAPRDWQKKYNKIPLDLALLLFGTSLMATFGIIGSGGTYLYSHFNLDDLLLLLFWGTIFTGLTIMQANYLYTRLKNRKTEESVWKDTYIGRLGQLFKNAFLNRRVGTQITLVLLFIFLLGISFGLGGLEEGFLIVAFLAFFIIGIPLFILILRRVGSFNKIVNHARAVSTGNFEPDLSIKGKSVLSDLAKSINIMKYGVKTSQNAQAKSERLKTELITNVSHDLRTPLTSIITYTELLKDLSINDDERNSYIEVIDRKSKRLKVLIDDLFEASKMASGAVELTKSTVNIVELLHQSLEEYHDSSVQLRISTPDHPVLAFVDGQKLSRVLENLIGNVVKYSLENTRAYISIVENENQVTITFKNITKYELSENIDELFERFKRGDDSRHTEGSGLGLAIAKSIIDLHEGDLDIEVDGDLFKVTIALPIKG